ncbi:MAG: GMC oxidoreductase [Daejeonella sp.]|uniref:GMC oxidoreductase n=1 Tax=Daejeonella sp. TaxID=2805397 RepID=UPI003C71383A
MKYEKYDLVVVGTGFASSFFLQKYLSKAPVTAKVLVLERGYLFPHADRLKIARGETTEDTNINVAAENTFVNTNEVSKKWIFTTGFGGSSNCWWGCTPRFLPSDFKMKSLYGIADDWPVTYEELEPYYNEAEEVMAISGPDETPFPRSKPYPLPPHLFTEVDRILHEKYGKQYISQPTARARQAAKGRNGCCASIACNLCPVNAKFTIENSGMPVYTDQRVEVAYGSQAYSLTLEGKSAKSIHFMKDGKELKISADVFALGANPIFNSNILLNSGDTNPFTGKGMGEQLGLQALVYLDNMRNTGGSTWVNANGYMLYDGEHRKDKAACLIEANNAPYIRLEQGKWLNIASYRMIFEDLPADQNYVTTTGDKLKPEVKFTGASEYTMRGVEHMKQKLPDILSVLPVEKIEYLEPFPDEGHILGASRMSSNPNEGVVDKNLIHHNYRNLFVLGSGAFTTYTPSNPTLTLSALSLMAADRSF